jgi:hypothetical protein
MWQPWSSQSIVHNIQPCLTQLRCAQQIRSERFGYDQCVLPVCITRHTVHVMLLREEYDFQDLAFMIPHSSVFSLEIIMQPFLCCLQIKRRMTNIYLSLSISHRVLERSATDKMINYFLTQWDFTMDCAERDTFESQKQNMTDVTTALPGKL